MDGFNRHYRLFRTESARAKHRFETADWLGQQRAQRERIEFYDLRVKECVRCRILQVTELKKVSASSGWWWLTSSPM